MKFNIVSTVLSRISVCHSAGQHLFRVVCLKLGKVKLNVTVGNGPSHTNPSPASAQATTQLSCAKPHSFKLRPKTDTSGNCPLLQSSSRNIQVGVAVGGRSLSEVGGTKLWHTSILLIVLCVRHHLWLTCAYLLQSVS